VNHGSRCVYCVGQCKVDLSMTGWRCLRSRCEWVKLRTGEGLQVSNLPREECGLVKSNQCVKGFSPVLETVERGAGVTVGSICLDVGCFCERRICGCLTYSLSYIVLVEEKYTHNVNHQSYKHPYLEKKQ
jgi:hypothetical protein